MSKQFLFTLFIYFPIAVFSQAEKIISDIDKDLSENRRTISDVLSEKSLMHLHSSKLFRDVIKKNAEAGEITIVTQNEPGVKTEINGTVTNKAGKPLANLLIYFYQTSDNGWYSDTGAHILVYEGDYGHARLFGYVKTDHAAGLKFIR